MDGEGVVKNRINYCNIIPYLRRFCLLSWALLSSLYVFALDQKIEFINLPFFKGQNNLHVYSIAQDSTGYLWFGTNNGLYRYDGYSFRAYKHDESDSTSLMHNDIHALAVDPYGSLWIGSPVGLIKYSPRDDSFINFHPPTDSYLNRRIKKVVCDSQSVWLKYAHEELHHFDPAAEKFTPIKVKGIEEVDQTELAVKDFIRQPDGSIWILTQHDLWYLSDKDFQVKHCYELPPDYTFCKMLDFQDSTHFWLSTINNQLINKSGKEYTTVGLLNLSADKWVKILSSFKTRPGNLWLATNFGGLCYLDIKTGKITSSYFDKDKIEGLNSSFIYSIYIDKSNVIWAGSLKDGLFRSISSEQDFRYHSFPISTDSIDHYVTLLAEDLQSNIISCLSLKGLASYNPSSKLFSFYRHDNQKPHSLISNHITSICLTKNGEKWIGTNLGLVKFNPVRGTFTTYKPDSSPKKSNLTNYIGGICESSDGTLWVGMLEGYLSKFDRNLLQFADQYYCERCYTDTSIIQNENAIIKIVEDKSGILWILTASGIRTFDPKNRKFLDHYTLTYKKNDPLFYVAIKNIFVSSDNCIWLCSAFNGLYKLDRTKNKFINYKDIEGLASNTIHSVIEDSLHNIWFSIDEGIALYHPAEDAFTTFPIEENAINNNIYSGNESISKGRKYTVGITLRNGDIILGTRNGFVQFDPKEFLNRKESPIYLNDFKVFYESRPLDKPFYAIKDINLTYKDYIFSFEFRLNDYTAPLSNKYTYWLSGFEKDWQAPGTNNRVTYYNIPPGKYTLKVKGCNSYGKWNQQPLEIKITITPPFWKTWWFRSIVALTLAGIICLAVWRRISQIQKQKAELEVMVQKRTQELHQTNEQLLDEIKYRQKAEAELRKSEEEYRDLFENAYDVIWTADVNGNIVTVNHFLQQLLGYPKNKIIGANLINYISDRHRFRAIRNYLKFLKIRFVECEIEVITKSGELKILWVKIRGITENSELVGIHGIGREITELKKAQEELKEAEKAKRESLKQLTLKIAHEIKNPLTSITSSAQLVAAAQDSRENPKIQRHMGVITKNVDICNKAIRDLYSFTHVPELNFKITPVSDLVNSLINYATERRERYPKVQLEIDLQTDDMTINIDEFRLLQAFRNLIDNAFEAINDTGALTIKAYHHEPENQVAIEIGDTGCGMDEAEIRNLYQPFFSTKNTGFGLGMTVVQDIIKAHSGTIQVQSEKNIGTVFTIQIPIINQST